MDVWLAGFRFGGFKFRLVLGKVVSGGVGGKNCELRIGLAPVFERGA
jgi:hypothetical protein